MRRFIALPMLAAIAASIAVPAFAQENTDEGDIPSVIVQSPDGGGVSGPNGGIWFVYELEAGETGQGQAIVHNPADVEQLVFFEIADLNFNASGSADVVRGDQIDVGAWGKTDISEAVIPANESLAVNFTLVVPLDAEPGDHIGVFKAKTVNSQGSFSIEREIAQRLYITVPGDVTPLWEIESVELTERSSFIPGAASLTVVLRNTGRIRVTPTVMAGDVEAIGSPVLLAKSVEQYHAEIDVPWWGGPVSVPVEVTTEDGQVRVAEASLMIIPVGPSIIALFAGVTLFGLRRWSKRRVGRTAGMQQDIERLERMLREQQGGGGAVPTPEHELDGEVVAEGAEAQDRRAALQMAAKRARRAGDHQSLTGVALRLHAHDNNALDLLLESAAVTTGDSDELLDAAASYGASALTHSAVQQLRPEQRHLLERRVAENLLGMNSSTASATVGAATPAVNAGNLDLEQVPGLGAAKRQALLDHFGSVEAVAHATVDQLTAVKGIGPGLAAKVNEHLDA